MLRKPRVLNPDEVPDQEPIVYRGTELGDAQTVVRRLRHGRATSPFI